MRHNNLYGVVISCCLVVVFGCVQQVPQKKPASPFETEKKDDVKAGTQDEEPRQFPGTTPERKETREEIAAKLAGTFGALTHENMSYYMDNQRQEIERELPSDFFFQTMDLHHFSDETLQINLISEASFAIDSAEVNSAIQPSLNILGRIIRDYSSTVVHVIGHTDISGTRTYNQQLSVQRAEAVARILSEAGVQISRIRLEGRGESDPQVRNQPLRERKKNRRVEIFLKPLVQDKEIWALESPKY